MSSTALNLPTSPTCQVCGNPVQGTTTLASSVSDLGLTATAIEAWNKLIQLQIKYNLVASRKRAFGLTVGSVSPLRIPWTVGHIASIFIPAAAVWMGGDLNVQSGVGGNAGLPIGANQGFVFGPEEGDSDTYLIASTASVDVRCFELIP